MQMYRLINHYANKPHHKQLFYYKKEIILA